MKPNGHFAAKDFLFKVELNVVFTHFICQKSFSRLDDEPEIKILELARQEIYTPEIIFKTNAFIILKNQIVL